MAPGALTSEEWARAWELMRSATELPLPEQKPFVQSSGAGERVIAQVLEMLDANEDADDAPEPGRQYGRYMLVRFLGRGGMGEVFQAHDSDLGRLVALKFVGANARLLPAAVDRVINEARAASALNHPNLVTVYEFLRLPSGMALVTEFVDGAPLRLYCATPEAPARVADWGAQIARGLAAAHAAGIVHGDIKPENVMLREDGLIKVLDFGLAQPHGLVDKLAMPFGTIGYMSPEQTLGKPLTGASDIFSLGSLLLELLSGRHPFRESNASATTMAIKHRDAVIPDHIETKAGGPVFAKLLASMLRKNPADRPTAAQVAAELEGIAMHAKPAHKRRWVIAASAIAGALLLATAARVLLRSPVTPLYLTDPVAVTTAPGPESQPTLSPDGSQVAFIWPGPDARPGNTANAHWIQAPVFPETTEEKAGVYVKPLDKDGVRRLTPDALEESSPAWSPDGASIAFFRHAQDGGDAEVVVTPAGGGAARSIGRVSDPKLFRGIAWWPDSRSVVVSDTGAEGRMLVRIPMNGAKTALTAPAGAQDSLPAISPDGAILAFVRTQPNAWQLCRMELRSGHAAEDARCIAWPARIESLVWAGGPHQLVFSDAQGLWLANMEGSRPGAPVRFQSGAFGDLAANREGSLLVFSQRYADNNLWKLDVATGRESKLRTALWDEDEPDISSTGEIVFKSQAHGSEFFVCNGDCRNPRQLTALGGAVGSPRWSPDGKWVAFDANNVPVAGSNRHTAFPNIYVISSAGGEARRLTGDNIACVVPGWSHDGKWIYYIQDLGGLSTWKIPFEGGPAVPVQKTEMWDVIDGGDGYLYYERPRQTTGLWRRPVEGGSEEPVSGAENAFYRYWDLKSGSIFFLRSGPHPEFDALDLKTLRVRTVGVPSRIYTGPRTVAASPGGEFVIYMNSMADGDLMRAALRKR